MPLSHGGGGLLAVSLMVWGLQRLARPWLAAVPGTGAVVAVEGTFVLVSFLTVFAIVIVVLERARAEVAALKAFHEQLVEGLGEGLGSLTRCQRRIAGGVHWRVSRCYQP